MRDPRAASCIGMAAFCFHLIFFLTCACLAHQTSCKVDYSYPASSANLSTVWKSGVPDPAAGANLNEYAANPLLLRSLAALEYDSLFFGAGFYCVFPCNTFIFGVYAVSIMNRTNEQNLYANIHSVTLVWSANRDHQVQANATLSFTGDGDLILRDADGSLVWYSGTSGRSVVGMNMTESGNLVLFDNDKATVWQSFDHPVDTLLPGQRLLVGKSLIPSMSSTNMTTVSTNLTTSNQFYLTVRPDGLYLYAFVGYQVPRLYYKITTDEFMAMTGRHDRLTYINLRNGSLAGGLSASTEECIFFLLPASQSLLQFMRFDFDGHLRLYEWDSEWTAQDILELDKGDYPFLCGDYGICSGGQCSCPISSSTSDTYSGNLDDRKPNHGCILDPPISCQQSLKHHQLILLPNVSNLNYIDQNTGVATDEESCKQACLRNCSCKAALFRYYDDVSNGSCLLVSETLSLVGSSRGSAFLKVHKTQRSVNKRSVISYTLGGTAAALLLLAIVGFIIRCRRNEEEAADDDELGELTGMPARYTFESLKLATKEFTSKIGEGGFSSVFKGELGGQLVAVKHLHRASQGKKEFLAEVQTIGSLHHINLVRLVGFCIEKSQKLLVYEYVSRGSLDKWIYYADNKSPLDWHTRCKIITDIAKGLSSLHEECRQRIAHLDIKPQNILLDDNFDAKVADFGLCKLIDRGQSRVVTRMRGTPGYLAPEWLTSQITEKVDVYSFGVMVMEIICGRKNLDYSQPEESSHLISILQEKARNGQLVDLIDNNYGDELQVHTEEVIQMMKLAMWCLQTDYNKRPQMSVVVKVLEGAVNVETNIEYSFGSMVPANLGNEGNLASSAAFLASHLSGPR